jgi:hypothetical protein
MFFLFSFILFHFWLRVFLLRPGRPARTPSERSRARSLDDLSKSCQQQARMPGDPPQHHHHHHHAQQLGSDNGLDKIDWENSTPFDPVVGWHSLAGQSSSGSPPRQKLLAKRLEYRDDGSEEEEEEEEEDEENEVKYGISLQKRKLFD